MLNILHAYYSIKHFKSLKGERIRRRSQVLGVKRQGCLLDDKHDQQRPPKSRQIEHVPEALQGPNATLKALHAERQARRVYRARHIPVHAEREDGRGGRGSEVEGLGGGGDWGKGM